MTGTCLRLFCEKGGGNQGAPPPPLGSDDKKEEETGSQEYFVYPSYSLGGEKRKMPASTVPT